MATFVLIHGGWHGGWCWRFVAEKLRSTGNRVFTPTLTGLGERVHLARPELSWGNAVDDVIGVIEAEELWGITLVGHSLGAVVASMVVERCPDRIDSLISLDGVLLRNGESLRSSFTLEQKEMFEAALSAGAIAFPPPPPETFGVLDVDAAAWVGRRLSPQPFGFATSPITLHSEPGEGFRCGYIASIAPVHPFVIESHHYARHHERWDFKEISACHDAMITDPDLIADMLAMLA